MPHVASDAPTHATKPKLHGPAHATQPSDRSPGSNFASLLDESQPANDARQPAPAKQAAAPEQSHAADNKSDIKTKQPADSAPAKQCADKDSADNDTAAPPATGVVVEETATAGVQKSEAAAETQDEQKAAESAPGNDNQPSVATLADLNGLPAESQTPATPPVPGLATPPPASLSAEPHAIVNRMTLPVGARIDQNALPSDEIKLALAQGGNGKPQPAGAPDKQAAAHAAEAAPADAHAAAPGPAAVAADAPPAAPKTADITQPPPSFNPAPQHDVARAQADVAAPTPPTLPPTAAPIAGLAVEIAGKAMAGKNRFEIRLDPPELGRIEVRLDVDRDGKVSSRLIADRQETLDLLRRDATGLERALQDAGLKTADNSLQFSLRDHGTQRDQSYVPSPAAQIIVKDEALPAADLPSSHMRHAGLGGGIDIRV